jgi:predicted MFS family arabinose efflux permease
MTGKRSETQIIALVAAIQFVNILDFMMVMPLGPFFASALDIPTSHLGVIGGAYTAAAGLSGLAGSFFLDRFDRRSALAVAMFGLVLGTLAGGFATGLTTLLAARVVAGAFGGPATSLSMSIIADIVPPERRGRALGMVMTSFSVSSVLGVPTGLWLAEHGGFRTPFFAVAGLGLVLAAAAVFLLPKMRGHLDGPARAQPSYGELLRRPTVFLSYGLTAVTMASVFIIVPNIASYVVFNLGYSQSQYKFLYMAGGLATVVALRVVGILVDKVGPVRVATLGTVLYVGILYLAFVGPVPWMPVMLVFILFMITSSFRNVPYQTLASRVPAPAERARFMSLQSAVQHIASAIAGVLSSKMLSTRPDNGLIGMDKVAMAGMALSLAVPVLMMMIERRLPAPAAASA